MVVTKTPHGREVKRQTIAYRDKNLSQNKDFGSRSRRGRVLTRRHTEVCRGLKTRAKRRDWAKRLF